MSLINCHIDSNQDKSIYLQNSEVINRIDTNLPDSKIEQNDGFYSTIENSSVESAYPNPFNPNTNITFVIPNKSLVVIQAFNMTGQLVSTITNKAYSKGRHSVQFSAESLPTGVYFIRTKIGSFVNTQTITLIK